MKKKRMLVACEYSAIVRSAFEDAGWEAWSCDLLPSERPGHHVQGDVRSLLKHRWDLVIAHPPCTYLANSGVRWLYSQEGRWENMRGGAEFFRLFLNLPHVPCVCIENPIMHKHAKGVIGHSHSQVIQPWQFGHGETKAVCLWLKGLPHLSPTDIVDGRHARVHLMAPGPDRQKERSRFYTGIAKAMAEQWTTVKPTQKPFIE